MEGLHIVTDMTTRLKDETLFIFIASSSDAV